MRWLRGCASGQWCQGGGTVCCSWQVWFGETRNRKKALETEEKVAVTTVMGLRRVSVSSFIHSSGDINRLSRTVYRIVLSAKSREGDRASVFMFWCVMSFSSFTKCLLRVFYVPATSFYPWNQEQDQLPPLPSPAAPVWAHAGSQRCPPGWPATTPRRPSCSWPNVCPCSQPSAL